MKRLIVLVGLLGVAAVGVRQLIQSDKGTIEGGAARAAESVRKQGPRVADNVAAGIEKVGSATERGANTLREMTSGEEENAEPEPEEAT